MAAGLATLQEIEKPGFYEKLGETTARLAEGLADRAAAKGVSLQTASLGGMFGFVFTDDGPISRYEQVVNADIDAFRQFFHGMLNRGVYLAPSAFEAGFVSAAHGPDEIEKTLAAAEDVFCELAI